MVIPPPAPAKPPAPANPGKPAGRAFAAAGRAVAAAATQRGESRESAARRGGAALVLLDLDAGEEAAREQDHGDQSQREGTEQPPAPATR